MVALFTKQTINNDISVLPTLRYSNTYMLLLIEHDFSEIIAFRKEKKLQKIVKYMEQDDKYWELLTKFAGLVWLS